MNTNTLNDFIFNIHAGKGALVWSLVSINFGVLSVVILIARHRKKKSN